MAQQTAVEWLMDNLRLIDKNAYNELYEQYEQAKAMEKEQILKAYNESFRLRYYPYETADVYFDKMYNKEK